MKKLILSIALLLAISTYAHAAPEVPPFVDAGVALQDAGKAPASTTVTITTTPADALPNPAAHPVQALDDAKLAHKTSWPLAVWACLAMLGKALAYGADKLKGMPLFGWLSAWLAQGKHAMWIAAIGVMGAAGYNTLIAGGTVVAAVVASGVAIAGLTHSTTTNAAPATTV